MKIKFAGYKFIMALAVFSAVLVLLFGVLSVSVLKFHNLINPGRFRETLLFDGYDWIYLSRSGFKKGIVPDIKNNILRLIFENTKIVNSDFLKIDKPYSYYVLAVDDYYKDRRNLKLPVFFAFKIAEMRDNNSTPNQIAVYEDWVANGLKKSKLVSPDVK